MRSRSPSRRNTPPPPRISRRSPGSFRQRGGKSPERRRRMPPPAGVPKYVPGGRGGSPTRGRERRGEFHHSPRRGSYTQVQMVRPRRSRSPLQREPKARSFSPGKRKLSPKRERERMRVREPERMRPRSPERSREPPVREREPSHMDLPPPRKRTRSKSPDAPPMGSRMSSYAASVCGPADLSPARSYQAPSAPYPQTGPGSDREETNRTGGSLSDRFHASANAPYKKESEQPVFRGPEGGGFDINELKKITMVFRCHPQVEMDPIERNIINPEDVVLRRRPGIQPDDREYGTLSREVLPSRGFYEDRMTAWERDTNHYVHAVNKREGSRPIFQREEIIQASARMNSAPPVEEHRRLVAIVDETPPPVQSQGGGGGGGSRFESPGRYSDARPRSRDGYYPPSERDPPPREYSRSSRDYDRGHGPPPEFEPRERSRDDHFDRRSEDLRHELDMRRRDDRYPSQENRRYERSMEYRGGDSDRGSSDLRMRINEKRTDRHDDREPSHHRMMDHMDRERSHRPMMQPSPPGSDHRRGPGDGFGRSMDDGKMHHSGSSGNRRMMHHGGPSNRHHEGPQERFEEPPYFHSERSHYNKSWDPDPEHVPKGRSYFEHDNRDNEFIVRGRGRGNTFRGNAFRGRGTMRRPFRGGPNRGMSRGPRRGGYVPRGFVRMY